MHTPPPQDHSLQPNPQIQTSRLWMSWANIYHEPRLPSLQDTIQRLPLPGVISSRKTKRDSFTPPSRSAKESRPRSSFSTVSIALVHFGICHGGGTTLRGSSTRSILRQTEPVRCSPPESRTSTERPAARPPSNATRTLATKSAGTSSKSTVAKCSIDTSKSAF